MNNSDTTSEEKTPVPSPSGSFNQSETSEDDKRSTGIVPVDIFVKHTSDDDRGNVLRKVSLTRTTSADNATEIRPSLLARAQMFFQKQLEGFSSSSTAATTTANNVDTKSEDETSKPDGVASTISEKHSDVTDTENQSEVVSIDTDSSTASVKNVRRTTSLPPVNARHITPEKLVKQKIHNRDKSPYRLMPDVPRRHQHLSANSPTSSQGRILSSYIFAIRNITSLFCFDLNFFNIKVEVRTPVEDTSQTITVHPSLGISLVAIQKI